MAKKKYVVRVVCIKDERLPMSVTDFPPDAFIECLRYAGLITVHPSEIYVEQTEHGRLEMDKTTFDLHCPNGLLSDVWAEQTSAKMRSFGYNAVKAPSTV